MKNILVELGVKEDVERKSVEYDGFEVMNVDGEWNISANEYCFDDLIDLCYESDDWNYYLKVMDSKDSVILLRRLKSKGKTK